MSRCPVCDLTLVPHQVAGQVAEGCAECGGWLLPATTLRDYLREGSPALAELARLQSGGLAHLAQRPGVCRQCGQPMARRTLAVAPGVPLLTCQGCRCLFLTPGQSRALLAAVSPQLVADPPSPPLPTPRPPAPEPDADEVPTLTERLGLLRALWWAPRLDGQPRFSWFVCAMPLWVALLLVLAPVWCADVPYPPAVRLQALGGWLLQTVVLLVTLKVTWGMTGEDPGLSVLELTGLLLRATPVITLVAHWTHLALWGLCDLWLGGFTGQFVAFCVGGTVELCVRLLLCWSIFELEWRDLRVLATVEWVVTAWGAQWLAAVFAGG